MARGKRDKQSRRILVGQIELLLRNVGSSVLTAVLVTFTLVWALANAHNKLALWLWGASIIGIKLASALHARRVMRSAIAPARAPRVVRALIALNAASGAAWGALAWVTLDSSSPTQSILVVAVLSGIAGSSMSLLSPSLPVFLAFISAEFIVAFAKFMQIGDPSYTTLGLVLSLYLVSVTLQARNNTAAVIAGIKLRFENVELLDELRSESERAQLARQQAVDASLAKSKFLAAASHDLRQPIHALGLFLAVLDRSDLAAFQRKVLDNARSVSDASADMLNTLLDFSRIEASVIEAQLRPFSLQTLLNKIESELAPQANAKGLIYRTRETRLIGYSDPSLVELILRNFVSNAIRYSVKGGILVACRVRGGMIRLEVWDTGIGIDARQHREIFREFHQLGNLERDRRKGLGLGLAIADGLARTLGHDLTLSSRLGQGSVFRLALPRSSLPLPPEPNREVSFASRRIAAHVLVVDDDESVREGMAALLQSWGASCDAVATIEQALAAAHRRRPDIVISDFRLRDEDNGAMAIAALRAQLGQTLPALLITGDTGPDRQREALLSRIPLLHKPVAPSTLHQKLLLLLNAG